MKIIVKKKNNYALNKVIEWLLYMVCYTIVFILVSLLFDSFYIDINHYYTYSFLAVLIIYLLNRSIKPILFYLTLPITGITLGLFYPILNLFILKLTDWILGSHFDLGNIYVALFISILLSICNFLVEEIIIKPIIRRHKNG